MSDLKEGTYLCQLTGFIRVRKEPNGFNVVKAKFELKEIGSDGGIICFFSRFDSSVGDDRLLRQLKNCGFKHDDLRHIIDGSDNGCTSTVDITVGSRGEVFWIFETKEKKARELSESSDLIERIVRLNPGVSYLEIRDFAGPRYREALSECIKEGRVFTIDKGGYLSSQYFPGVNPESNAASKNKDSQDVIGAKNSDSTSILAARIVDIVSKCPDLSFTQIKAIMGNDKRVSELMKLGMQRGELIPSDKKLTRSTTYTAKAV